MAHRIAKAPLEIAIGNGIKEASKNPCVTRNIKIKITGIKSIPYSFFISQKIN
jgi:hypothetical protein